LRARRVGVKREATGNRRDDNAPSHISALPGQQASAYGVSKQVLKRLCSDPLPSCRLHRLQGSP
jgi:hypothetical protein